VSPYNLGPPCLSTQVRYGCLSNNMGGYLCITAIWRYCTVYYGTDAMYHDWYLKSCFLSASQGMVGNNNVSLHNLGVELCLPTIWVRLSTQLFKVPKIGFQSLFCFQACVN
jgi:hypothetical protein